MDDQYSGDCIVDLMHKVDSHHEIPRPKVAIGGKIVNTGALEVCVGLEAIESFRKIEAEKQAAVASGKPSKQAVWQTEDPQVKVMMKAIAKEAGFPDVFD